MLTCPRCHTRYEQGTGTCPLDGETLVAEEGEEGLTAGTKVGEYVIEGLLGVGGFGAVYRAVHPIIGKSAAIKVLNRQYSATPEIVSRFVAEARSVNQIRHKNIIDIFSFGQLPDGRHYYVMELLRGATLDRYLAERGGRLTVIEAAPVVRGIARALSAAHAAGIVHRDLKPENVFIAEDDEGGVLPKLIDFGIAKLLGDAPASSHKTRTGAPIGTPYYMSPEQCRGRGVDQRTDVYALGVLVHVLLTGKRPFDGEDVMDVLMKQITTPPPRMSEVADLPPELDEPVLHMLAKSADERPSSVAAALEELETAMGTGRRSSLPSRPLLTPSTPPQADLQALGEARTMLDVVSEVPAAVTPPAPAGGTLEPASRSLTNGETPVLAAQPVRAGGDARRRLAMPVAGAALGALAIGLWVARSGGDANVGAQTIATSAAPPVVTASAAHPTPTVVPAEAVPVELHIAATPEIVDVLEGERWLGTSRDPIRVPRAETITLTFKASGHAPATLTVPATTSHTVTVKLTPAAAPASSSSMPATKPPPAGKPAPVDKHPSPAKRPPGKGGDPSDISF